MTTKPSRIRVFLSYHSDPEDSSFVSKVHSLLQTQPRLDSFFWPQRGRGDNLPVELERQLRESDALIIFAGKIAGEYQQLEVSFHRKLGNDRRTILVQLETEVPDGLKFATANMVAIKTDRGDPADCASRIARSLVGEWVRTSPRVLESSSSAVLFTHFGSLSYGKDDAEWDKRKPAYEKRYKQVFENYLSCAKDSPRLRLIYVYIDAAMKELILTHRFDVLDSSLLRRETKVKGFLHRLERATRAELDLGPEERVRIRYLGVVELLLFMMSLNEIDDTLVEYFSGKGQFTYDTPKFIEAILRLARLGNDPIIRIDEDVRLDATSLECLLREHDRLWRASAMFLFSGHYGRRPDSGGVGRSPTEPSDDFLNDYAVRLHFLLPREVRYHTGGRIDLATRNRIVRFLADLDYLGAPQFMGSANHYSDALHEIIKARKATPRPRTSAQVVSGAGLIMSPRAVEFLPPFMNFSQKVIWIDDFIKRRLHESIHHILPDDLERLDDAVFQQDRHPEPDGVTDDDMNGADEYLKRLLRGCILTYILSDPDSDSDSYVSHVHRLVKFAGFRGKSTFSQDERQSMEAKMRRMAEERYADVIKCWSQPIYAGTRLQECLGQWQSVVASHRDDICGKVIANAIEYLKLLEQWLVIVHTIRRLPPEENDWLFE